MKQSALIIFVAVLALIGGLLAQQSNAPKISTQTTAVPGFNLPDLQGHTHLLTEWQNKVIVLNFWATWCPPCRKEIPEFIKLQTQYGAQGLQFIGVALEEKEPVEEYLDFTAINYPILIGGDQGIALSRQLGNTVGALPFSVVIDRQGQIVQRQAGEFSREAIVKTIEPLL